MNTLEIVLINSRDETTDNKISFRRRQNDGFLLTYKENLVTWVNEKTPSDVYSYVEDLLDFIMLDADPYKYIQFAIPAHPIVFLRVGDLNSVVVGALLHTVHDYIYKPPVAFK